MTQTASPGPINIHNQLLANVSSFKTLQLINSPALISVSYFINTQCLKETVIFLTKTAAGVTPWDTETNAIYNIQQ